MKKDVWVQQGFDVGFDALKACGRERSLVDVRSDLRQSPQLRALKSKLRRGRKCARRSSMNAFKARTCAPFYKYTCMR
eukprot:3999000-Pleurochrysis_carterae.AAC.1